MCYLLTFLLFCSSCFPNYTNVYGSFSPHNIKYLWPGVGLPIEERSYLDHTGLAPGLSWVPSGSETAMTAVPVSGTVRSPAQWLLECNKPEKLTEYGQLYSKSGLKGAARLMLFHINKTGRPGFISLKVTTKKSTRIWLSGGVAGPDVSELYVGQRLVRAFFDHDHLAIGTDDGYVRTWTIGPDQVLGGLLDIWTEPDVTYNVSVLFHEEVHAVGVFPRLGSSPCYSYAEQEARIIVKEPTRRYNLSLGREDYLRSGKDILEGNYGVLHRFRVVFMHPGRYEISFTANGGPARLLARVGDQYWNGYANVDSRIGELIIALPQEVIIETIPLPGSNYPATLTIQKKP